MSTRWSPMALACILLVGGCSSGDSPTEPSSAPNIAGSYSGTASVRQSGGTDCNQTPFGFISINVEGDVRQSGSSLDMDVSIVIPDDTSFAPVVCFFDGTLTGTSFSATLRECSAPPSRGADPRLGVQCADDTTRDIAAIGGTWNGTFNNGRHSGTAEVTFSSTDPTTGNRGVSVIISRDLDMTRGG